jgi:hypothetical protein
MRNSKIRALLAYRLGALWARAMGDDCMEQNARADLIEAYWDVFGMTVVEPELPPEVEAEFCSCWFYADGRVVPQSWPRTLFRILNRRPDPAELMQFADELRAHERVHEFVEFLLSLGWRR